MRTAGRYVEPFLGSACFFFYVQPQQAVLADINADLIKTYGAVRNCTLDVASELCQLPVNKHTYYELRQIRSEAMSTPAAAARFIYLNRFCFNGLYRTNVHGDFNVPFAPIGTGRLPSAGQLSSCAELLKRASLYHADFEDTLALVQEGDFVYLDPPYAVRSRRVFRQYSPNDFGPDDLVRFCRQLRRIDTIGASFVASYADCAEGRDAFRRWHVRRVRTRRNIAGFAAHRRHVFELIATNIDEENR